MSVREYDIRISSLPLAVYREIAAHLRQINQVDTELLTQDAQHFDYALSQIGWLRIRHPDNLDQSDQAQLQQILDYYSQRFGKWIPKTDGDQLSTDR